MVCDSEHHKFCIPRPTHPPGHILPLLNATPSLSLTPTTVYLPPRCLHLDCWWVGCLPASSRFPHRTHTTHTTHISNITARLLTPVYLTAARAPAYLLTPPPYIILSRQGASPDILLPFRRSTCFHSTALFAPHYCAISRHLTRRGRARPRTARQDGRTGTVTGGTFSSGYRSVLSTPPLPFAQHTSTPRLPHGLSPHNALTRTFSTCAQARIIFGWVHAFLRQRGTQRYYYCKPSGTRSSVGVLARTRLCWSR